MPKHNDPRRQRVLHLSRVRHAASNVSYLLKHYEVAMTMYSFDHISGVVDPLFYNEQKIML